MIDESTIGSIVDSIGFAMVETDPKNIAAATADTYPIITLESLILRSINYNPCTQHGYSIDIKT